jgi:hypothetical protein
MGASMPGSSTTGNNAVLELIGHLDIETILDVGPGRGQWYDLLHPWFPTARFDGWEIFQPYVDRYQLLKRYETVYLGDVRWEIPVPDYDLVIFGDVLEHMTMEEAMTVVGRLLTKYAIISIPLGLCPQEATEENPYEAHVSTWYDLGVLAAFPQIVSSIVQKQDPLMGAGIGRGVYLLEK